MNTELIPKAELQNTSGTLSATEVAPEILQQVN